MLRRTFALVAFILLALPAFQAGAQGVPTLTLGSAATINLLPPGPITADGKRISLTVLVTDETGALANGARFRGSASSVGRLDQDCPQVGPGLYTCGYVTPEKVVPSAELRLSARLASGTELRATFPVEVVADAKARLTFSAAPAEIVLMQDPSSTITISVVDESGAALKGLDLRASANIGQVQALTESAPGVWSAAYVPPTTPFPQVALVSVWDSDSPGNVFGFFRIPLIGKVDYPVDARAAGVTLVFKVGDRTFPPITTDATGRARVPILVPPGVPSASVEMTQAGGARSTQNIDLQVPPFKRIAIGGLPAFVPADGEGQIRVRIFAVDKKGRPSDAEQIALTASAGQIGAPHPLGNGLFEAPYTPPALDAAATATISAALVGEEASSSDTAEIGLEPTPPAQIVLAANPAQIAQGVTSATLTARILDAAGQPATGKSTVEFRTTTGPVANPKAEGPGVFSAGIPVQWDKRIRAQVIAAVKGNRQAVRQFVALPLSDLVVTGQKVPITVLSLDRYGNPVADVPIDLTVTMGGGTAPASVQTDARGMGTIDYQAGPLGGLAIVTFTTGTVSYATPIWQASEPMEPFEFPVSGGQRQGSTQARWRKLRAFVDLGTVPPPVVATVEPSGGLWGAGGGTTGGTAGTTGGSPWGTTGGTTGGTAGGSPWGVQGGTTGGTGGSPWGTVATASGPVAAIEVSSIPGSVPLTGGTVNILVKVTDATGLLVRGEPVILIADGGTITSKTDNGDGTTSAILSIPPDLGRSQVQVTATRPAGDVAGFARIAVGDQPTSTRPVRTPREPRTQSAATVAPEGRAAHRMAQIWGGWTPGLYSYDSTPCMGTSGCDAPADADLDGYDFLKVQIRNADGTGPMGIPGSFGVGGEVFPLNDAMGWLSVGPRVTYSRYSYQTDFEARAGEGDAHCDSHFCDGMGFLTAEFQARFALLRDKGPLDILVRVGYQFQDVVVFRRLYNPDTGAREPRFETLGLHSGRYGIGVRYTVVPMVRPHLDYTMVGPGTATLNEDSFGVSGITNHEFAVGLSLLPVKGLLLDLTYDLTTRALALGFTNEAGVVQRGSLDEQAHTFRVSAGWAF